MATLIHRPASKLPSTELPWLSLKDHFIATVGPMAGSGARMGPLLVLADATFAPRSRFPLHPHREMEILSIVLEGTLSHHGDQADGASIVARSAQLISSRNGMTHAEGNDTDRPTRMLQIWFEPREHGGPTAWFSRVFPDRGRHLIAGDEVMPLRTDVKVWWLDLDPGRTESLHLGPDRQGYLLATDTTLTVSGASTVTLGAGDGLSVAPGALRVTAERPGVVIWIDAA